jgi:hypothetical protein
MEPATSEVQVPAAQASPPPTRADRPRIVLAEMHRRLRGNLAALAEHRPQIHALLMQSGPPADLAIQRAPGGRWTLGAGGQDARAVGAGHAQDPIGATVTTWGQIKPAWQRGTPLALCGIGDGYALAALMSAPPPLLLGQQQVLFIIEPLPRVLWGVLALHDFSGPDGPIRQARCRWFVGPDWAEQFQAEIVANPGLPFPEAQLFMGVEPSAVEKVFQQTLGAVLEADRQLAEQIAEIYSAVDARALAELFGENPPRRPRVLLLTSRFTTVLQYSTADTAEAMAKLGWETRTVMEEAAHLVAHKRVLRQSVLEFKPDLVFVIDHLRAEFDQVFPPALPFACWVQDYLPNLKNAEAAAKVGRRDFVLTTTGTEFVRNFGYPARQIIDTPNLGRVPVRPPARTSDGLDLAYTSNWSQTTERAVDDILAKLSVSDQMRAIGEAACARILDIYDSGGCLPVQRDVRHAIEQAQSDCGIAIAEPALFDSVVNLFWQNLNNHLFRQQSLQWVTQIAQRRGWRLGLFGRGWKDHPQFGQFAKGFVKPGADLESLVRGTRINLHLEPYACFTHPRLLSGLFAGGFFLVRDNPFNHLSVTLGRFLSENVDAAVETTQEARQAIAPQRRDELEDVLLRCAPLGEQADTVQWVRNWQRAGLLPDRGEPIPHLAEIAFADAATLEQKMERFLSDAPARTRIAQAQRDDLQSRLSYEAGLRRMCRRIEKLVREEI